MTHRNKVWIEELPKIELHLHLEGAIPYTALWELVKKYDGDVQSEEALKKRFEYKDFAHFIDTWVWKNRFIREYEDFTFIAEAVARDLANQNIWYGEVFYSPPDFFRHGLETQQITEAIRKGIDKVEEIEIALVADMVRDFGGARAETTLAEVNEVKHLGVVGIGLGGSEPEYPPEMFKSVFTKAKQLGFHTNAHAGEAAGSESIWGAIHELGVDRIGHGTQAEEDEHLLDFLVESKTPLEMCPISNVRTGVVKSYEEHPVRRYIERGIVLSINTDDPKMFGNSLAEEYWLLMEKHGFTQDEIKNLLLGSIEVSWMPVEKKQAMHSKMINNPSWISKTTGG